MFVASGCFDCKNGDDSEKFRCGYREIVQLSKESRFTVNELESLLELFKELSSSIIDDGLIHKMFDLFDEKRNGVIEFEEFVHALNVFHPDAPVEEKIDFSFKLYDLRQTGFIEQEELKQMVIAILTESELEISDELLDLIINRTFAHADADMDNKIGKDEWKAFVLQHPSLLRNITIPHLKDISSVFPRFVLTREFED